MKKTLAILLSLALVICMIPATAFAEPVSTPVQLTSDNVKPYASANSATYTGSTQTPQILFKYKKEDNTEVPLTEGTDYTITWDNNPIKGVSTYTATITGDGTNYTGTVNNIATYKINALNLSEIECYIPDLTDVDINNPEMIVSKTKFGTINGTALVNDIQAAVSNKSDSRATITFSKKGESGNVEGTASKDVEYLKGLKSIDVMPSLFNYTGNSIVPTGYTVTNNNDEVVSTSAYTISCSNNINAGTAKMKATAVEKSEYTGSVETTFAINPIPASEAISKGILRVADITAKQVAGVEPKVTVTQKINGTWETVPKDDYKIVASDDGKTGTATITFNSGSNYTNEGTAITKTYTVVSSANNISNKISDADVVVTGATVTYNGTAQKPTSISLKNVIDVIVNKDYVIKYEDAAGVRTEKPTAAGTYKIVIEGIGSYAGEVMTTKTFTINKLDLSEKNASNVTAVFSGTTSDPVTVKVNGNTLKRYTDYNVDSYNSSKTIYTVTGTGSCYGTRIVYVSTRSIASCTINFTDNRSSVAYGSTYYPKVTAYYGSTKLYENTDYTLSYKNSKNQTVSYCKDTGTYSVIVTGIGAYTGTKTLYFTIIGTDISNYTVTLKESSVTATGYSQTPVITSVKYGYYSSLSSNDYTVSYQDATGKTVYSMSAPGTYRVVVTGKNGYSGSTYATFRIVGTPQTVTVNQDSYKVYPTSDSFKITAKATGDGTGFTYTSSNPAVASVSSTGVVTMHKVGKAVIRVTTTGNKKYEPAYKDVTVKVYPKKTALAKKPWTAGKKAQLKVRWNYQDGATKYQIRYSRDKNFKAGTYLTKTVNAHGKDYTTQSTTLKKLKRGYTYYVKVRAVYTDPVTGDNYYGSWSGWRSAKTI